MKSLIQAQVKDSQVASRLTPDYDIGCKRAAVSDTYLPTFNKEFVHLNTTRIERVTSRGIVTVDNVEHQFDAIVFATGFDVAKSINAFELVVGGKGGQESIHKEEDNTPREASARHRP